MLRNTESSKTAAKKSDKQVHEFKIAGVPYRLKSSHDEETVNQLIQLVQSKVEDALKLTKNGSFQNAAVLAAMNLAEELLLLKKKAHRELSRLEEKAQLLVEQIDQTNQSNLNRQSKSGH